MPRSSLICFVDTNKQTLSCSTLSEKLYLTAAWPHARLGLDRSILNTEGNNTFPSHKSTSCRPSSTGNWGDPGTRLKTTKSHLCCLCFHYIWITVTMRQISPFPRQCYHVVLCHFLLCDSVMFAWTLERRRAFLVFLSECFWVIFLLLKVSALKQFANTLRVL